jgi:hypothetical protein
MKPSDITIKFTGTSTLSATARIVARHLTALADELEQAGDSERSPQQITTMAACDAQRDHEDRIMTACKLYGKGDECDCVAVCRADAP